MGEPPAAPSTLPALRHGELTRQSATPITIPMVIDGKEVETGVLYDGDPPLVAQLYDRCARDCTIIAQ